MDTLLSKNILHKGDCPLHYFTSERVEGRANLVLIHGAGADRKSFNQLIEMLPEKYNILSVDLRGHGASMPAAQMITAELLIEDVADVLKDANINEAILIGQGIGGAIIQELVFRNKDLAKGLGIIGTPCIFGKLSVMERVSYSLMDVILKTFSYDRIRKNLAFSTSGVIEGREYIHNCISRMRRVNLMAAVKASVDAVNPQKDFTSDVFGFVELGTREVLCRSKKVFRTYAKHLPNCDVYSINGASNLAQFDAPKATSELVERLYLRIYSPAEYKKAMDKFKREYEKAVEKARREQEERDAQIKRAKEESKKKKKK